MAKVKPPPKPPRIRILLGASVALGPGRVALLESIIQTGSISGAAREMSMSYRRAWTLVEATNQAFKEPLVKAETGGAGGGGALVTEAGHEALRRYRLMEEKATAAVKSDAAAFAKLMNPEEDDA